MCNVLMSVRQYEGCLAQGLERGMFDTEPNLIFRNFGFILALHLLDTLYKPKVHKYCTKIHK